MQSGKVDPLSVKQMLQKFGRVQLIVSTLRWEPEHKPQYGDHGQRGKTLALSASPALSALYLHPLAGVAQPRFRQHNHQGARIRKIKTRQEIDKKMQHI